MNNDYLISLAVAAMLIIIAISSRKLYKSWAAPSSFFLLTWSLFLTLPLLITPHYYVSSTAVIWIFFASASLYLGNILSTNLVTPVVSTEKKWAFLNKELTSSKNKKQIYIMSTAGILAAILSTPDSLSDLSSINDIENLARESAVSRYSEDQVPPVISSIFLAFCYYGSMLGGMRFATKLILKSKFEITPFLPLIILSLMGVIQNTKATLLYGTILFLSSLFTILVYQSRGKIKLFTFKSFILSSLMLFVFFELFIWMQMSRYDFKPDSYNISLGKISVSAFGFLGGFSVWLDGFISQNNTDLGLGINTLKGITDLFSDSIQGQRPQQLPKQLSDGYQTNVDTIFSEIISDFGLTGGLFFLLALGYVLGVTYKLFISGRILPIALMIPFYSVTLWGFTTSMLNYSSITLSFIVLFTYFFYLRIKATKR